MVRSGASSAAHRAGSKVSGAHASLAARVAAKPDSITSLVVGNADVIAATAVQGAINNSSVGQAIHDKVGVDASTVIAGLDRSMPKVRKANTAAIKGEIFALARHFGGRVPGTLAEFAKGGSGGSSGDAAPSGKRSKTTLVPEVSGASPAVAGLPAVTATPGAKAATTAAKRAPAHVAPPAEMSV